MTQELEPNFIEPTEAGETSTETESDIEKPTTKEVFEKNLQLFLAELRNPDSKVNREGLADLIESHFFNAGSVVYKDTPDGEEWKDTAWNIDKIVASWKNSRGIEIYPQFADENIDAKHILQHETGHAIFESGLLESDRKELYKEVAQIPLELHSQYIQNITQLKNEDGSQKLTAKNIMLEAVPELLAAWMKSDGTPVDMMRQYLSLGDDGWVKILENQGVSSPEELPQLKNFDKICAMFNKNLSEKSAQNMQETIKELNLDDDDLYDDASLGGESFWPTNSQSGASGGGPTNIFDVILKWMSK